MSGLCGVCQYGLEMESGRLQPMLSALALADEPGSETLCGVSAALGVARRWPGQRVAAIPGIRVAVDADLCNARELTELLAQSGLEVSSMPLAEQVAWLYRLRGSSFVEDLHGGFAIAVWDEKEQRLLLAVDRLGVKRLYWHKEGDRLLFATRAGAIRAVQEEPAAVNLAAVMQFLLLSVVPTPLAIYKGIEKLPPGYLLIYERGAVSQQQYWDLEYPESSNQDSSYWARELREQMRSAVQRHLEGCEAATTGAYLSGGTDSSSVVAFMNERHTPVNTFSISFEESRYNEIGFARITANAFSTRHHERCVTPQDAFAAVPKITQYYDEPFANSSAIAAYYCALLARESGMEVLLAGDGGDELFAGNERYAYDKYFALYHEIPRWLRRGVVEPLSKLLPENDGWLSMPRRYLRRADIPNPRRILSYNPFLSARPEDLWEDGFLAEVPQDTWMEIAESHFQHAHASSGLNRLLYLDVKITLADNDLRKVAGTAELAGVRVRFPLLDDRLAEFSGRIPSGLKLRGFDKRYISKQAMAPILPQQVLHKKKHGFGVPLGLWFLQDPKLNSLMQEILCDSRTRQRGYFRPGFYDKLAQLHRQENAAFYGEAIWYLVMLELWHREHFERHQEIRHAH